MFTARVKKIYTALQHRIHTHKIKELGVHTGWMTFSSVLITITNLGSVFVLANLLPPYVYGQYKIITTWLSTAQGVGYNGYSYTLPQHIARNGTYNLRKILRETMLKSLPASIGLVFFALYYVTKNNANLGIAFLLAGIAVPLLCATTVITHYFIGKKDFKRSALVQNSVDLVQFIGVVIVAQFYTNFIVLIGSYLLITICSSVLSILYTIHHAKKDPQNTAFQAIHAGDDHSIHRKKLNISGIIYSFAYSFDKLLIFHIIGPIELAAYSIITAIADQGRVPLKTIAVALLPRISTHNTGYKKMLILFFLLTGISILFTAILILLLPLIFTYLFPAYTDHIHLAQITALSIIFGPVSFLYSYIQSKNLLKEITRYTYLGTILNVLLFSFAALSHSLLYFVLARIVVLCISTAYLLRICHTHAREL